MFRRGYINTKYQNHPPDIASNDLYFVVDHSSLPSPGDELICGYTVLSVKLHINGSFKSSKIKYIGRFISLETE
jgi:hypothetical protein